MSNIEPLTPSPLTRLSARRSSLAVRRYRDSRLPNRSKNHPEPLVHLHTDMGTLHPILDMYRPKRVDILFLVIDQLRNLLHRKLGISEVLQGRSKKAKGSLVSSTLCCNTI
jgi:hypothetical protein